MMGFTKLGRHGITVNEGAGPVNFTLIWSGPFAPFAYIYFFGKRFHTGPKINA